MQSTIVHIRTALARELPERPALELEAMARRVAQSLERSRLQDREDPW